MRDYIYLDNNATTKLAKEALKAMLFDLKGPPYNPSSPHFFGRKANLLLSGIYHMECESHHSNERQDVTTQYYITETVSWRQ